MAGQTILPLNSLHPPAPAFMDLNVYRYFLYGFFTFNCFIIPVLHVVDYWFYIGRQLLPRTLGSYVAFRVGWLYVCPLRWLLRERLFPFTLHTGTYNFLFLPVLLLLVLLFLLPLVLCYSQFQHLPFSISHFTFPIIPYPLCIMHYPVACSLVSATPATAIIQSKCSPGNWFPSYVASIQRQIINLLWRPPPKVQRPLPSSSFIRVIFLIMGRRYHLIYYYPPMPIIPTSL